MKQGNMDQFAVHENVSRMNLMITILGCGIIWSPKVTILFIFLASGSFQASRDYSHNV